MLGVGKCHHFSSYHDRPLGLAFILDAATPYKRPTVLQLLLVSLLNTINTIVHAI